MKHILVSICLLVAGLVSQLAIAETRTSADYAIPAEALDSGGARVASANYTSDCGIGAIGGMAAVGAPLLVAKSGYVGQLYDAVGLAIGASPTNVNEAASRQLGAAQVMDDGTLLALPATSISWGIVSGPINGISPGGLATSGNVYQDTPAIVSGGMGGFGTTLGLLVANVTSDDFGIYATDGIDDDWQVYYFGEENPLAGPRNDPDADGRDNLFESLALTIPTDAASYFQLRASRNPGQASGVDLTFGPVRVDRIYTVQYSLDLSPGGWNPLDGGPSNDDGDSRILTDPDATGPRKFYRVLIGR